MEQSRRKNNNLEISRMLENFPKEYCRTLLNIPEWDTVELYRTFRKVLILGDCSRVFFMQK